MKIVSDFTVADLIGLKPGKRYYLKGKFTLRHPGSKHSPKMKELVQVARDSKVTIGVSSKEEEGRLIVEFKAIGSRQAIITFNNALQVWAQKDMGQ